MKKFTAFLFLAVFLTGTVIFAADDMVELLNGKFDDWTISNEAKAFSFEDGILKVNGSCSHLFYNGPVNNHSWKDLHIQAVVMTKKKANSGIFIHTAFQKEGWPKQGYECQIDNTHPDPQKTGGIYNKTKINPAPAKDDVWFTYDIYVIGKRVITLVDGKICSDWLEPDGIPADEPGKLSQGTIAIQAHDPESIVYFKSFKIGPLPHTLVPANKMNEQWWKDRHQANIDRINKGNVDFLMVGDSITHGWDLSGAPIQKYYYEDRNYINMGFGGDQTQHVLWRLANAPMDKIQPKAAMLLIGVNSLWGDWNNCSFNDALGIRACIDKLQSLYPNIQILVLNVFVALEKADNPIRTRIAKTNDYLPQLLKEYKNITIKDINHLWLDKNNSIPKDLMNDFVHPTEKGYKYWGAEVEPIITKMLNVPAKADLLDPIALKYNRINVSNKFHGEGAAVGDFNKDGIKDIVSGHFWYEGPDFKKSHQIYEGKDFDPEGYSNCFVMFTGDFNADGWQDIVVCPHPGVTGYWYENPKGKEGFWKAHEITVELGNESQAWCDIDNDGQNELIFNRNGYFGYVSYDTKNPDSPWKFTSVSEKNDKYQRYYHGNGVGDINGDNRIDLIEKDGWFEQPENAKQSPWKFHPFKFAEAASNILVYDVDGDGLNDVVTAWHCHLYGLVWFKQVRKDGKIDFVRNDIIPTDPPAGFQSKISQLHALFAVDMNGDGVKDFITGKRWWAHGSKGDIATNDPAILMWWETKRGQNGSVQMIPHIIDVNSGVGTQVTAEDLNGDKVPDIIVGNKKGTVVFLSK